MLHNSEKDFIKRHIGPSRKDEKDMLGQLGYQNINELISQNVPEKILFKGELNIGEPNSEYEALRKLKAISRKNQIFSNFPIFYKVFEISSKSFEFVYPPFFGGAASQHLGLSVRPPVRPPVRPSVSSS